MLILIGLFSRLIPLIEAQCEVIKTEQPLSHYAHTNETKIGDICNAANEKWDSYFKEECNCRNTSACYSVTGCGSQGCKDGWTGRSCQIGQPTKIVNTKGQKGENYDRVSSDHRLEGFPILGRYKIKHHTLCKSRQHHMMIELTSSHSGYTCICLSNDVITHRNPGEFRAGVKFGTGFFFADDTQPSSRYYQCKGERTIISYNLYDSIDSCGTSVELQYENLTYYKNVRAMCTHLSATRVGIKKLFIKTPDTFEKAQLKWKNRGSLQLTVTFPKSLRAVDTLVIQFNDQEKNVSYRDIKSQTYTETFDNVDPKRSYSAKVFYSSDPVDLSTFSDKTEVSVSPCVDNMGIEPRLEDWKGPSFTSRNISWVERVPKGCLAKYNVSVVPIDTCGDVCLSSNYLTGPLRTTGPQDTDTVDGYERTVTVHGLQLRMSYKVHMLAVTPGDKDRTFLIEKVIRDDYYERWLIKNVKFSESEEWILVKWEKPDHCSIQQYKGLNFVVMHRGANDTEKSPTRRVCAASNVEGWTRSEKLNDRNFTENGAQLKLKKTEYVVNYQIAVCVSDCHDSISELRLNFTAEIITFEGGKCPITEADTIFMIVYLCFQIPCFVILLLMCIAQEHEIRNYEEEMKNIELAENQP